MPFKLGGIVKLPPSIKGTSDVEVDNLAKQAVQQAANLRLQDDAFKVNVEYPSTFDKAKFKSEDAFKDAYCSNLRNKLQSRLDKADLHVSVRDRQVYIVKGARVRQSLSAEKATPSGP